MPLLPASFHGATASRLMLWLALLLPLTGAQAPPEGGVITSAVAWTDTSGNRIYAGGANVVWEPSLGRFFMVGEGNKTMSDCSGCINLYSAPTLGSQANWRFEGCVLRNEDVRAAAPPPFNDPAKYPFYRLERPKIFRCPTTKTPDVNPWRLVFHCDTDGFAMTSIGVLTAPNVTGPYIFAGPCFQPDGHASYDMGVFVDDARMPGGDGRAYLARSYENSFAGISGFDDECLTTTGLVSGRDTPKMEAQAIMRDAAGTLHMIGSHETGWGPNAAIFLTSPNASLVGAVWQNAYNPSGDGSTYQSQSSFLFPFHHADGNVTHIYMGDRWNAYGPGGLQNMTQIWLPLLPPSGPAPSNVTAGWALQTTLCNASDPTQQLAWHLDGTVTHEPSGLCITADAFDPNEDQALSAQACVPGAPGQAWFKTGVAFSNTSFGFGNGCSNWNAGNGFALGASIILYRCGNQTQWNSRFDAPLTPGTPGLFQGLSDISLTGYCLAMRPKHDPSLFYMPWLDSWTLGEYAAGAEESAAAAAARSPRAVEMAQAPAPAPPARGGRRPRAAAAAARPLAADVAVVVNDTQPLRRISGPSFLNVNIDTGSLFHALDYNDPALINYMYALTMNTNGEIRIGGGAADFAIYLPNSTDPTGGNSSCRVTVISDATLDAIFSFAAQTHATVLFDLNARQFRTASGAWDPAANATALLQRLDARFGGAIQWSWSLGNEPSGWGPGMANYTQLGLDVFTLQSLLKGFNIGRAVFGASFAGLGLDVIEPFLVASKGALQGLTVHDYPLGRNCSLAAFLDRAHVDHLSARLRAVSNLTRSVADWYVELVLEEVAANDDGGCDGLTNRFADGFVLQASLAAVAEAGFDRYSRQDLVGWSSTQTPSSYSLVGPPGWTTGTAAMRPHPSWFTAMLFKQLVGRSSLSAQLSGDAGLLAQVTVAAWCPGAPWWFEDALIVQFANPTGADVVISVATASGGFDTGTYTAYVLTSSADAFFEARARAEAGKPATLAAPLAPPASLTSDDTFLNGVLWTVNDNGVPPAAGPVPGDVVTSPTITLPAYSHGFVRFGNGGGSGLKAC